MNATSVYPVIASRWCDGNASIVTLIRYNMGPAVLSLIVGLTVLSANKSLIRLINSSAKSILGPVII